MKKFFSNIFIILYTVCAIAVTVCLLSYNEYKVTEFGNYSLIIVDSNDLKGDFEKGSLVIVDRDEDVEVGEKAFFYNTSKQYEIALADVINVEEISEDEITYTFMGGKKISSSYMVGSADDAVVIPTLGAILGVVESKWGYLFLVVLPSLLAFLYEITKAVEEVKNSKEDDEK